MPIVYSLISRGESIICEATHPLHSGNFKQVSLKLLHKVHTQQSTKPKPASSSSSSSSPPSYTKQTLLFNGHTFNFCCHDSIYALAMCDAGMRPTTPFLFLTDVLDTFLRVSNEGQSKIEGTSLKALTESLQNKMEQYSDESYITAQQQQQPIDTQSSSLSSAASSASAGEVNATTPLASSSSSCSSSSSLSSSSKSRAARPSPSPSVDEADDAVEGGGQDRAVQNVRRELDGVKDQLMDNLDRVISRGEALESLVDRSVALNESSDQFKAASSRLKSQLRWQQVRTAITLLTMSAICLYIVAAAKCGVALNQCG